MTDEELAQWLDNVFESLLERPLDWSYHPKDIHHAWLLTARQTRKKFEKVFAQRENELQKKVHCQEICNYWHSLYEQELELNNALLGEAEELKSHFLKGEQDGK